MTEILGAALGNLLSPVILFFVLGFVAALARSDLSIPEAVGKTLGIYLMLAIGFKGGVEMARAGFTADAIGALAAGMVLSFSIPFVAYALLRATSRLSPTDAAAVSAHYGSISVVTFVTATGFLASRATGYEGYMVAVVAVMEAPAVISALLIAGRHMGGNHGGNIGGDNGGNREDRGKLLREIAVNGSIVMLIGAFVIGWITGDAGLTAIAPFIVDPFTGVLCLFLLDMGLIAARRLRQAPPIGWETIIFGIYMPILSALLALPLALLLGLSVGGATVLLTLAASASYIVVPAALRLALPEANPGIYLSMSLAVTFPFNIIVGIPLYYTLAQWIL